MVRKDMSRGPAVALVVLAVLLSVLSTALTVSTIYSDSEEVSSHDQVASASASLTVTHPPVASGQVTFEVVDR